MRRSGNRKSSVCLPQRRSMHSANRRGGGIFENFSPLLLHAEGDLGVYKGIVVDYLNDAAQLPPEELLRNLRRAGKLKKRSSICIRVPGFAGVSEWSVIRPASQRSRPPVSRARGAAAYLHARDRGGRSRAPRRDSRASRCSQGRRACLSCSSRSARRRAEAPQRLCRSRRPLSRTNFCRPAQCRAKSTSPLRRASFR